MPRVFRRAVLSLLVPVILLAITACPGVIVNNIQITLGPNGAIVAASITFSCISPVTGDVVQYNWVFGDGATATGQTVSYAYSSEGTFVVECHVLTSNSVLIFTDVITIGPRFTNLYWVTFFDEQVQTCPLAACSNATVNTLVDSGLSGPFGIAATTTNLYWTEYNSNSIWTCPIGNCTNATATPLLTSVNTGLRGLTATETDLYWSDDITDEIQTCSIGSCSNGTVKTLVDSGLNIPIGIVARGSILYWADALNSRIVSCPIGSCSNASVTVVVDSLPDTPLGLTASDTDLYWTGSTGSDIYTCPINNCSSATVLVNSVDNPQMITVGRSDSPLPKFTLSVDGSGDGDVTSTKSINCSFVSGVASGTCDETYTVGSTATLTATPATDFAFDSWTNCSNPSGSACNHTVTSDVTITANFVELFTLTIVGTGVDSDFVRITSDTGGIDCPGTCQATYPAGTMVELTATDTNGMFVEWFQCVSSTNNVINVTMNSDLTCEAQGSF